jgi:hypothetical protein
MTITNPFPAVWVITEGNQSWEIKARNRWHALAIWEMVK